MRHCGGRSSRRWLPSTRLRYEPRTDFRIVGDSHQFSELAGLIEDELTVYLIGGGALTLQDLKNATKDVDNMI